MHWHTMLILGLVGFLAWDFYNFWQHGSAILSPLWNLIPGVYAGSGAV